MLIGELIEDLFDFLDVIAEDCCISDRPFTALHPHLAAMIIIFNIHFSYSLLLLFLTASCLALTDSAGIVQL